MSLLSFASIKTALALIPHIDTEMQQKVRPIPRYALCLPCCGTQPNLDDLFKGPVRTIDVPLSNTHFVIHLGLTFLFFEHEAILYSLYTSFAMVRQR